MCHPVKAALKNIFCRPPMVSVITVDEDGTRWHFVTAHSGAPHRQHLLLASGEIGPPSTHLPGSVRAGAEFLGDIPPQEVCPLTAVPAPPISQPRCAECCYRRSASRSLLTKHRPTRFYLLNFNKMSQAGGKKMLLPGGALSPTLRCTAPASC